MKYPGSVERIFIRQGGGAAIGTIIDGHLAEEDAKALYAVWDEHGDWPEPLEFRGGEKAITCEMVVELVGDQGPAENREQKEQAFVGAFGKKQAEIAHRILAAARQNAGR